MSFADWIFCAGLVAIAALLIAEKKRQPTTYHLISFQAVPQDRSGVTIYSTNSVSGQGVTAVGAMLNLKETRHYTSVVLLLWQDITKEDYEEFNKSWGK